jgi:hypothetical protein
MIKYFCDSCGKEKKSLRSVEVPCHLYPYYDSCGYVDEENNSISGRMNGIHLCNKCSNIFYTNALKSVNLLGDKK